MLSPLQTMLQQLLSKTDTNEQRVSEDSIAPKFSGKSVKKINTFKTELSNFMLSKADYASISDKKLVERLCQLCDTQPDERFDLRNQETCAKTLADIICKHIENNSDNISDEFSGYESNGSDKGYESWNEQNSSQPNPNVKEKETSTFEHTKACGNDDEAQEKNPIKLLSKKETDTMLKEVLDTYNLVFSTEYKTLREFYRADSEKNRTASNEMIYSYLPLLTVTLEILRLSEDFQGKTTKELLTHLGIINDNIEDEMWENLEETINSQEKIIKTQEDLDQVISEFRFYINDIKLREKHMTGLEDPKVKFSSVGEYSIHSKDPKERKIVQERLAELKEKALRTYKDDVNKMRATIDYAMYRANREFVHSNSRVSGLLFNSSPFLAYENDIIRNKVLDTYHLYHDHKENLISTDEFEQKLKDSKYGNCDLFAVKIFDIFKELNYSKGEFGQIFLTTNRFKMGHSFNFITTGKKITIVDSWKNMIFDLGSFKTFLSEYTDKNDAYKIEFKPNVEKSEHDIIRILSSPKKIDTALILINSLYEPPEDDNILSPPPRP